MKTFYQIIEELRLNFVKHGKVQARQNGKTSLFLGFSFGYLKALDDMKKRLK